MPGKKITSSGFATKKARKPARKTIDTIVTFLEMDHAPALRIMPPVNLKLALMHVEDPTVGYYRYLYDAVGRDYYWIDRKKLSDDQLAAEINADGVSVHVAYCAGCPAGYFELDARKPDEIWLAYFGVIADFQGMGLGKWLMSEAIRTAWAQKPGKLRVETCTLDAPHALALYQRMGFVPYERKEKTMVLPD